MYQRLKYTLYLFLFVAAMQSTTAQDGIKVTMLLDLNASGGVTADKAGNIYISDFGPQLGNLDSATNVYKWDKRTGEVSVFASGFLGASGACFDAEGNFYQSNPFGASISKISADGTVDLKWCDEGLKTPVGLETDKDGNIYVSNCGMHEIGKISPDGNYQTFAKSDLFKCPNGLTQDPEGNLYACNFGSGHILKITPDGRVSTLVELQSLQGGPNPVGNGHLIYSNGWIYATTIGRGELFRIGLDGSYEKIAGIPGAFKNVAGDAETASFSKPNGIAASITGDSLFINVSEPTWITNPRGLHPAKVMMVSGICSLPDSGCDRTSNISTVSYLEVNPDLLDTCEVRSLFLDADNNLWIGTRQNGIYKKTTDRLLKVGDNLGAISFAQDWKGDIWFSARGLWRLSGNELRAYTEEETGSRVLFSVETGVDDYMIASGSSDVTILKDGKVTEKIGEKEGLPHPVVHDTYLAPDGAMWLATRKAGLNSYRNGEWESFLSDVNCRKILVTSDNRMLLGTSTGLLEFDINSKSANWIKQDGFALLPMIEAKGEIYCVGEENGLWKLQKNNKLKKVKIPDNLIVYSVSSDLNDQLVIGTQRGLVTIK